MKYRYCNLILDLNRYILSILGQQRMGITPVTHTQHVSGWNWDEEWRVWEAALFPMLSLPMEGITPLSLSISACVPTKLQISCVLLYKSNFGGNFGTTYKK